MDKSSALLSQTEKEILKMIRQGKTSAEIAEIKGCSPRTVEKHRSNIIKKLEVKSAPNALLLWTLNNPQ
jgi:DNA-binding CsgD family transcriptional regulator